MMTNDLPDDQAHLHRDLRRHQRHIRQLKSELAEAHAGNRILAERLRQTEARIRVTEATPSTN